MKPSEVIEFVQNIKIDKRLDKNYPNPIDTNYSFLDVLSEIIRHKAREMAQANFGIMLVEASRQFQGVDSFIMNVETRDGFDDNGNTYTCTDVAIYEKSEEEEFPDEGIREFFENESEEIAEAFNASEIKLEIDFASHREFLAQDVISGLEAFERLVQHAFGFAIFLKDHSIR